MDKIIENLQNFNFTKIEAEVYLCLLKNGQLNGSQISKCLGVSRTSVYSALDSLYSKGHIFMLAGEPTLYKVQEPKHMMEEIKSNYSSSLDYLENSLSSFQVFDSEEQFWNIKGLENFISNAKRMLLTANKEVCISTNFDLQLFKEELMKLGERGIRIIVFSFDRLEVGSLPVEFYHHEEKRLTCEGRRWMMVIDNSQAFIANENSYNDIFGTFTRNQLMVSIIAEHIHHDIYLLKLKNKYHSDIVTEDILIDSYFENKSSSYSNK